jgi:hypothetical protein
MNPVCGRVDLWEKPANVFFCWPSRATWPEGILDRVVSPPAAPMTLAATEVPKDKKVNTLTPL